MMSKQNIRLAIIFALFLVGMYLFNTWQQEHPANAPAVNVAPDAHNELPNQPITAQYCTSETCLNGGRCLAMNNSILCSCKKNYFGPKCEYLSNNFKTRESCFKIAL